MIIVYCLNSIQQIGGIASIIISKANAFSKHNIEVYIIVTDHNPQIETKLSKTVKLINLNINYYKDDWKSNLNVLKGFFIKRRQHKNKLKEILNHIQPDIVISVGQCEKYFLSEIKGKWKTIREFHYDKHYRKRNSKNFFHKIISNFINFYDYNIKIKHYDRIIVLTNEDKKNWLNNNKVFVIPNFTTIKSKINYIRNEKKIIAIGRLEYQKNFQSLIEAFRYVNKKYPDWTLDIWGEGSLKLDLENLIKKFKLEKKVNLCGIAVNLDNIYKFGDILVMTSRFEGFPLSMLEGMSYGLPVIAYDFPCGPKDVIIQNRNGIIVPQFDILKLSESIIYLIENKSIRLKMGMQALETVNLFSEEKIVKKWIKLFKSLI